MRRIVSVACLILICVGNEFPGTPQRRFDVTGATIASTQEAIREGLTTCRAVVESYINRIQYYDQRPINGLRLNSIVTLNPRALTEADECDHSFAAVHKLPLLGGIVVLVKDNYDTQEMQTTGGSLAMKGFQPDFDSTLVRRLREAGAIVLAKTNMAEWAFSPYITSSSIAGITRNPYDLDRVPAGSSGGTAAAVAASLGESGLGTDTGNSIRGPSSHTALVGIRPTIGLTSRAGIIPLFSNNDVGGPMARTVADAAALLTVLAGADQRDPATLTSASRPALDYTHSLDRHGLRGANIGVFRQFLNTSTTDPQVKELTENALTVLRDEGATLVDPFLMPEYNSLEGSLWCGDFEADLNRYLVAHPNAPYHNLASIVESGLFLPYIEEQIRAAIKPSKADDRRLPCLDVYHDPRKIKFRQALIAAMNSQHVDALVYPTWSNPPRKVGDLESPAGDNSQILSPQTGFPSITVPMGFTYGSLPAGLTFIGPAYSESLLVRYSYDFEQATKMRREPPLFPPLP